MLDYSNSFYSLIPPFIALAMTIITRKVLLSLCSAILLGALLLFDFSPLDTALYLIEEFKNLFYTLDPITKNIDIKTWNLSVLIFIFLLGIITALLTLSGGTLAFAKWAQTKIKDKRGAKLLAVFIGVFIFIDDYFNSLAVGAVARPITDKFNVSRAKLAYILDSTAAPICILMPISSWGAYILTLLGSILATHQITTYSKFGAFMAMVPMNYYAIFALLMVFCVAWFQIDIGPMLKHEMAADGNVDLVSNSKFSISKQTGDDLDKIVESENGKVRDLLIPILVLIIVTIMVMLYTGFLVSENRAFYSIVENANVALALVCGGVAGVLAALISIFFQKTPTRQVFQAILIGLKSMFGAALLLLSAWTICAIIGDLKTGSYISNYLLRSSFNTDFLPLLLFLTAFIMAFATGSSWGTFGVMLPIAADMAQAIDITILLPTLAAVLAGSVCGDHCSPMSDTTILSSTGAKCNHIDHVITQLPYALLVAFIASIGYFVMGITKSPLMGFISCAICFAIMVLGMHYLSLRAYNRLRNSNTNTITCC